MAIATDSYYDVIYDGDTLDRIGLSKTLNNYTTAEIGTMTYCGTEYLMAKNLSHWEHVTLLGWDLPKPFDVEDGQHIGNGGKYVLSPGTSTYQYPNGLPLSVIWLSFGYGSTPPAYITNRNSAILNSTKIITELDAPKYEIVMAQPIQKGGKGATAWSDPDNDLYAMALYYHDGHDNLLRYRVNNNVTVTALPTGGPVCPYAFFEADGNFMLFQMSPQNHQWYTRGNGTGSPWIPNAVYSGGGPWINFEHNMDYGCSCNVATLYKNSFAGEAIEFPYTWYYSENYSGQDWGVPLQCFGYNDLGEPIELYFIGAPADGNGSQRGLTLQTFCKDRDQIYKIIAGGGIKFVTDRTYKPIIKDGWVTGYTDDMSAESELDGWHGTTAHSVSPTPPTPPTPSEGDDIDDHSMGAGTGISGMANLWLLTASQLADLHASCNNAPVGFDPLNSFISVMGIGTNPEYLTHEIQYITPINIRMSDGTTWQTGVEGHIVSSQVSAFSFTGITVQRKYNNFLDFSPYATHEIFVPMCGWITLPDIAVDRPITVTYIPDIESLKCRAVVSVVDNSGHKCVIGEKDGIMGADVPFTNVGHSLYVGDAIVNGADVAGEAITMAIGAGFTKANAKGGTYRPYEGFTLGGTGTLPSAIGNAIVSGNINRTHFMSGNGTRIGFSDGENIQIKSVYHNVDIPLNYAHTVGLMCNKTGELSEFTGFTVCDNPHINFSALEAEKEEIKRLLEEGVIL